MYDDIDMYLRQLERQASRAGVGEARCVYAKPVNTAPSEAHCRLSGMILHGTTMFTNFCLKGLILETRTCPKTSCGREREAKVSINRNRRIGADRYYCAHQAQIQPNLAQV